MLLIKQLVHITRTFGPAHAWRRVSDAIRAKLNEWLRSYRHNRRIRGRPADQDTVQITCIGKIFELKTTDFGLHRDLIADRIREPVATSLMLRYADQNDILLDAGANIGYFSLLLADRCHKVYAVEPDISNYNALKRNIEINSVENIHTYNLAFSDSTETLYLNQSHKSNWHTTSKNSARDATTIQAMTIDEFCTREKITPTVMKMDIEGFEKHVIPGAEKTLTALKALFFELHSSVLSLDETNHILDVIEDAGLNLKHVIRYDRPGLWKSEPLSAITAIRKGDYGIYELIYLNQGISLA